MYETCLDLFQSFHIIDNPNKKNKFLQSLSNFQFVKLQFQDLLLILYNQLFKVNKIVHHILLSNATVGAVVNNVENKEEDRKADPAYPVQIFWIKPTQKLISSSLHILIFHVPVFYPCCDKGDTHRLHENGKDGEEACIEVNIHSCEVRDPWYR